MTTATNNVTIPKGYFFRQSKQEYANVYDRLIAELFQNSVDAKATEIRLNFTPTGYVMLDNGKGMSAETMVKALLTFGGSEKEDDSTGGFGYAKVLLLFSMASFKIHSKTTLAYGEGLQYQLDSNYTNYNGTIVSGQFPEGWNPGFENMETRAKKFLSKCHLRCRVFINDEEFTNWDCVTRSIRHNEWSKLYCSKTTVDQYYITVRKSGLFMFEKYVGQIKKKIILEVQGSSKDVFTANRDGFRQVQDQEFQALYSEIVIDKNSFDKSGSRVHLFKGRKAFDEWNSTQDATIRSKVRVHGANSYPVQVVVAVEAIDKLIKEQNITALKEMAKAYQHSDMEVEGRKIFDIARDAADAIQAFFDNDFVIDLGDSDHTDVPKRYIGSTMSVRNQNIAKLWKAALLFAIEANRLDVRFRIGFTLNTDRIAQFSRVDGIDEYLINPEKKDLNEVSKWEKCYRIMQLATHEIAHRVYQYHDENFVCLSEQILLKTLTAMKGDANVLAKKAKYLKI